MTTLREALELAKEGIEIHPKSSPEYMVCDALITLAAEQPKTCATCKHWGAPSSEYGEIPGVGLCLAVPHFWGVTEWDHDSDKRVLRKEYIGKKAFAQDSSDYSAVLKTMPDFGCVQYEAQEPKPCNYPDCKCPTENPCLQGRPCPDCGKPLGDVGDIHTCSPQEVK